MSSRSDEFKKGRTLNPNEFVRLFATPNTMDALPCCSYEAMKRQATNGGRKNRSRPSNLREQIDPLMCQAYCDAKAEANGLWPTPTVNGNNNRAGSSQKAGDGLATAVKLWATPSAADAVGSHGGGQGRSLRTDIHNWKKSLIPTPTACEYKGRGPNSNQQGLAEHVKMWPTPRVFMYKDSETDRGKGNLGEVVGGQLNPNWVEWLMGFPVGWTVQCFALNIPEPPIENAPWADEPNDVPRVATGVQNRVDRLKCLGNAVVPQQFYPIFKAIAIIDAKRMEESHAQSEVNTY